MSAVSMRWLRRELWRIRDGWALQARAERQHRMTSSYSRTRAETLEAAIGELDCLLGQMGEKPNAKGGRS